MSIPPITNSIPSIPDINAPKKTTASGSAAEVERSFTDMLTSLNQSQAETDNLVQKLALGEDVDLHTVMIGLEENNINFNVAIGIRDKLVEAYREVMRMQV